MSTIEEIDHLLKDVGAFVAGGQSEEMVSAAESKNLSENSSSA